MTGPRTRKRARAVAELGQLLREHEALMRRLEAALPPRPSGRDGAALAAVAEALPTLAERLGEAVAVLRRADRDRTEDEAMRKARRALRTVEPVLAMIGDVFASAAVPLIEENPPRSAGRMREAVLSDAFMTLEHAVNGTEQSEAMRGYGFPFIPFDPARFVAALQAAWRILAVLGRAQEARFLEVGCGAGSKLQIAGAFFAVADGIELDAGYVARAAAIPNPGTAVRRVFQADALAFERYGEYDAIYSYAPPELPDMQNALERRIHEQARDGTVIIAPVVRHSFLHTLPRIAPQIVVRGYRGEALEELRQEAERVGAVVPPPPEWRQRRSWTNPGAKACEILAQAGFAR